MYLMGQMAESQKSISKTLDAMETNLKTLNDQNVLHASLLRTVADEQKVRLDAHGTKLGKFTDRMFWLMVLLVVALLVALGLKETFQILPSVISGWFGG